MTAVNGMPNSSIFWPNLRANLVAGQVNSGKMTSAWGRQRSFPTPRRDDQRSKSGVGQLETIVDDTRLLGARAIYRRDSPRSEPRYILLQGADSREITNDRS